MKFTVVLLEFDELSVKIKGPDDIGQKVEKGSRRNLQIWIPFSGVPKHRELSLRLKNPPGGR